VVVLGEAGSGKSTEISEQVRLAKEAGQAVFSVTVRDAGTRGFESALTSADRSRLAAWRQSNEFGYFFLDSVDEAKAKDVRLKDALPSLAEAISGAEGRAHVVITGRYTDWEFRGDLETFKTLLPIPPADAPPPKLDPDQLIVATIRSERQEKPKPAEEPLVVVMAALDREQMRAFARGEGVEPVEPFFAEIDRKGLWDLARRPADLGWLVSYWRANKKLGALAEMLDLSLRERLTERDVQRSRTDSLDVARGLQALERIGAALVLSRLEAIAVPDTDIGLTVDRSLDIAEVLPDWSGDARAKLITKPVFDAASFGTARLHADNKGEVRGYLAARWLSRLLQENCPESRVRQLLFDTVYGIPVIRPSLRQTAAWMAITNDSVAAEIIKRDPGLLLEAGDPASLPTPVKQDALHKLLRRLIDGEELGLLDRDALQRFASPDLAATVRELWKEHFTVDAARQLLLRIIWLGEIKPCSDIAIAAAFGAHSDRLTQVFAGRALLATANDLDQRRYAKYVRENAAVIPRALIWDALDAMFPSIITVDDFLSILGGIDLTDGVGELGLGYYGSNLLERVNSAADAERILTGLFNRFKTDILGVHFDARDEALLSPIEAAAVKLLKLSNDRSMSANVIDVAIMLGKASRSLHRRRGKGAQLDVQMAVSPERRRLAIWGVVERMHAAPALYGHELNDPWQLEMLSLHLPITPDDADWLVDDAERRPKAAERRFATAALMRLRREAPLSDPVAQRLVRIASTDSDVGAVVESWTKPRTPDEEWIQQERRAEADQKKHKDELVAHDESWLKFAADLRKTPTQLRSLNTPTAQTMDGRLCNLWRLLRASGQNRRHNAIDDLSALAPMLGEDVVNETRNALIGYWRHGSPKLISERAADQRNVVRDFDQIGMTGVALEAATGPNWADCLSYDEAVLAATYATLEINGLPKWLTSLSQSQAKAVRDVLGRAIARDLDGTNAQHRPDTIQDIADADDDVVRLVSDVVLARLAKGDLPESVLRYALRILERGIDDRGKVVELLKSRFRSAPSVDLQSTYMAAMFRINNVEAAHLLIEKLDALPMTDQTLFVLQTLPKIVGSRISGNDLASKNLPMTTLERLVSIAYRTIRPEEDRDHSDGKVYTPDERDDAESARGALFNRLVDTPGPATIAAILRLADDPEIPIRSSRLRAIALDRAAHDSELNKPWRSRDVQAFESDYSTVPRTAGDLRRVLLDRLVDIQHDLLNHKFSQRKTLTRQLKELDVQLWTAHTLNERRGRSYTIDRESHLLDEKRPDLLARAQGADASVPIEIKIAEDWTLRELRAALSKQLASLYLRDKDDRFGILLLIHKKKRPKGWIDGHGKALTFAQVLATLQEQAAKESSADVNAPQTSVIALNVAGTAPRKKRRKALVPSTKSVRARKTKRTSSKRTSPRRVKSKRKR